MARMVLLRATQQTFSRSNAKWHRNLTGQQCVAFGSFTNSLLSSPLDTRSRDKKKKTKKFFPFGPLRNLSASATVITDTVTATATTKLVSPLQNTLEADTVSSLSPPLVFSPLSESFESADGTPLEPLTNTYPQDLLLKFLSYCHDHSELTWGVLLLTATISFRTLLIPLTIRTQQKMSRMQAVKPKLEATIERHKQDPSLTPEVKAAEIRGIYSEANANPLTTMGLQFLQMPIFMSFFFATRKLADYFPEANTEGLAWFPDLGAPDPSHIMPVVAGLTFMLTVKVGTDGQPPVEEGPMKNMKYVMFGLGLMTVPIAWNFPAATVFYWCVNNTFSLTQTAILNIPGVKPKLGILPPPTSKDTEAAKPPFGGASSISNLFANAPQPNKETSSFPEAEVIRPDSAVNHNPNKGGARKRRRKRKRKY